jgi:hypothetical protein
MMLALGMLTCAGCAMAIVQSDHELVWVGGQAEVQVCRPVTGEQCPAESTGVGQVCSTYKGGMMSGGMGSVLTAALSGLFSWLAAGAPGI